MEPSFNLFDKTINSEVTKLFKLPQSAINFSKVFNNEMPGLIRKFRKDLDPIGFLDIIDDVSKICDRAIISDPAKKHYLVNLLVQGLASKSKWTQIRSRSNKLATDPYKWILQSGYKVHRFYMEKYKINIGGTMLSESMFTPIDESDPTILSNDLGDDELKLEPITSGNYFVSDPGAMPKKSEEIEYPSLGEDGEEPDEKSEKGKKSKRKKSKNKSKN